MVIYVLLYPTASQIIRINTNLTNIICLQLTEPPLSWAGAKNTVFDINVFSKAISLTRVYLEWCKFYCYSESKFINGTQHGCSKINTVRRKDGSIFALEPQDLRSFSSFQSTFNFFNTKQIVFFECWTNQWYEFTRKPMLESGAIIFCPLGIVYCERIAWIQIEFKGSTSTSVCPF